MHIITRKRLNEFAIQHPDTKTALQHWYTRTKGSGFHCFAVVRAVFPRADSGRKTHCFQHSGNKVSLVAAMHYNRQKVYIRAVLTHKEYDQGTWKE